MPKHSDLIAAEMQGDATVPPAVKHAVAKAYENKDDARVVDSLRAIADDIERELSGNGNRANGDSNGRSHRSNALRRSIGRIRALKR